MRRCQIVPGDFVFQLPLEVEMAVAINDQKDLADFAVALAAAAVADGRWQDAVRCYGAAMRRYEAARDAERSHACRCEVFRYQNRMAAEVAEAG